MFCGLYSYSDIFINSCFYYTKDKKINFIKNIKNKIKNLGSTAVLKKKKQKHIQIGK